MERTKLKKQRVVIIGAGFGGLAAAFELANNSPKNDNPDKHLEITIIDQNDYQLFTPDLYEIASASQDVKTKNQLRDAVCVDIRVALRKKQVNFKLARAIKIDKVKKIVITDRGDVPYDYLIVAIGSVSEYFGIKGLQENSIALKTIDNAVTIRDEIYQKMQSQEQVQVLICGAGPAGVELAAEIMNSCRAHTEASCHATTIIEGKGVILPMFDKNTQKISERALKKLGVKFKTDYFIESVTKNAIVSNKGEKIKGDVIIWTGGIRAHPLLQESGFKVNKRGQVLVEKTTQVPSIPNVFVVGDSAQVPVDKNNFAIQTAHEALFEGPVAAKNIISLIHDEKMKTVFRTKDEGIAITLGGKNGLVILPSGLKLTGFLGWAVRKYIDFRHFKTVLPFTQAVTLWYRGLKVMTKND